MSSLSVVSLENLPERILHRVMNEIITKQENRVRMLSGERKTALRDIAECLIEKERVSGEYLRGIVSIA